MTEVPTRQAASETPISHNGISENSRRRINVATAPRAETTSKGAESVCKNQPRLTLRESAEDWFRQYLRFVSSLVMRVCYTFLWSLAMGKFRRAGSHNLYDFGLQIL